MLDGQIPSILYIYITDLLLNPWGYHEPQNLFISYNLFETSVMLFIYFVS